MLYDILWFEWNIWQLLRVLDWRTKIWLKKKKRTSEQLRAKTMCFVYTVFSNGPLLLRPLDI